jgi:hypothetical protein
MCFVFWKLGISGIVSGVRHSFYVFILLGRMACVICFIFCFFFKFKFSKCGFSNVRSHTFLFKVIEFAFFYFFLPMGKELFN